MSTIHIYSLVAIVIYVLMVMVVAYLTARKETKDDYIIGSRKVGVIGTSSSLIVSNFDGTGLVINLMFIAMYGFGFAWLFLGEALIGLILLFSSTFLYKFANSKQYVNVSDMFKDKIGYKTSKLSAFVITFVTLFSTAGQLFISGQLVSSFINLPYESLGVVLVAGVVSLYLFIGGYATVIKTDILQWFLVALVAVVAFIFADFSTFSFDLVKSDMLSKIETNQALGLFLWGLVFHVISPYSWQRLFSVKSEETLKQSFKVVIPSRFILGICLVFFVMTILSVNPSINSSNIVFEIYSNTDVLPVIGPLMAVVLLALIMSSLDTYGNVMTSTLTTQLFKVDYNKQKRRFVKYSKALVFPLFGTVSCIAIFISDFVNYMINTVSILLLLFPMFLTAMLVKNKNKLLDLLSTISFIIGLIVWIYMFYMDLFGNVLYSQIPMLISTCINVAIISFYRINTKQVKKEVVDI